NKGNAQTGTDFASVTVVPATSASHFVLSHDGFGINCLPEPLRVTAVNASGAVVTGYTGTITLNTGSGKGTWSLASGSGSFSDPVANDGLASYTFVAGDAGTVLFNLAYPEGATPLNILVSAGAIVDDNTEGLLAFTPSGFTVTSAPLNNPPPAVIPAFANQTAGTNFTAYLTAYGQTATDPLCGVIEAYAGARSLRFWTGYSNPAYAGLAAPVRPTVTAAATISADKFEDETATGLSVNFVAGQGQVTVKYKDVGRIGLNLKDVATPADPVSLPSGIRGDSGLFVVKPAGFSLGSIVRDADGFANPAAADENGAVFIKAGDPFRATVTARDAEGTATPSYGKETPPEGVALASTLVLPAAGANPALSNASAFGAFTAGSATGTTFAWGEVGIIRLTPAVADGDYLGAGTVTGTASGNVGRFIPFDFGSVSNAPEFAPACGRFSYLGQPFSYGTAPVITVTARNAGGIKTANYTGVFWKMTNASLSGKSYSAATGALDSSLLPAVDPVIVDSGDGTGTLTFSSGGGLGFVRGAPVAPFDAEIRLQINVQDSDGAAFAGNPAAFGNTVAGGGINFPVDPLDPLLQLKTMRFGRLSLQSAYGSELVPLRLPLRAEYYDGGGFVTNADDGCSSYDGTVATLGNYQLNLNAPETTASGAGSLIGGLFDPANPLQLSAPGAGNDGSVDLTLPVEFWLRYDWDGNGSHDNNPVGRGTFGIYGGTPRMIYTRETVR
ncbi:DUF6701 domain-containing protein, partial [Trichloromonas sp.]|uniref:DUF6701 domain-containing protein n=1 Tax=Trichloromonas sp. TaxID=3069249 RepID=UPI003D812DE5